MKVILCGLWFLGEVLIAKIKWKHFKLFLYRNLEASLNSLIQKTRVTDSLLHVRTTAAVGGAQVSAMEYLHRDHLGSVEAVTDAGGASLLVQAYDPFGERRKSDWMGMLSASERQTLADNQPLKTSRGYTGHEHLDRTGFIHMNGRLYDPQLGRFLSPDPIVAAPGSSQSWNSYSYVSNSPLSFVDPGGQFQAGIGCNVGYVMCMNGGGNTSGRGGGGSSQGTETVPIRTFNFHIGISFARVPVLRDPIGSIFGRGGGINDDPNGGINSDVCFGDLPSVSFRLIFNFFISITSNTETRQIQTTEEEQSPASRPMGVGAHRPDLGWLGNNIRNQVDTPFEKDNFERYWLGKGNLELSQEQFGEILSLLPDTSITFSQGAFNFVRDSQNFYAYKHDFYNTKYDGLLGRAWVIYDANLNPVGLFDRYDFNSKPWADRSIGNHIKTGLVRGASSFCDSCRPFNITFGVNSDSLQ